MAKKTGNKKAASTMGGETFYPEGKNFVGPGLVDPLAVEPVRHAAVPWRRR